MLRFYVPRVNSKKAGWIYFQIVTYKWRNDRFDYIDCGKVLDPKKTIIKKNIIVRLTIEYILENSSATRVVQDNGRYTRECLTDRKQL